jgi:hypothetical protein
LLLLGRSISPYDREVRNPEVLGDRRNDTTLPIPASSGQVNYVSSQCAVGRWRPT